MKKRIIYVVSFLLGTYLIAKITGLDAYFTKEEIKKLFENNMVISSLSYILIFTVGNLMYVPGWVFLSAAVWAVGNTHAYVLTLIAGNISCFVGFLIIRFLGKDSLRHIEKLWVQKSLKKIDEYPILVCLGLRSVFQTAPVLNYTLALSGINLRSYLIGTFLGIPLPIFIYLLIINKLI